MSVTEVEHHPLRGGFAWNEQRLQFSVREPFPSRTSGVELVFGSITPNAPLRIESHMPEKGIIFSDGVDTDYMDFNSGTIVTISLAENSGRLIWP